MKYVKSKVKKEEPQKPKYAPGRTETRDKKKIIEGVIKFILGIIIVNLILTYIFFLLSL